MKYAALLFNTTDDWQRWEAMSPEEAAAARAAEMPKWEALFAFVGPRWTGGYELGDRSGAKVVRVRDGETQITDGPFADTKEVVGGLAILECENLDEAIEIAAKVPLADRGAVEIRPIVER
jgi:hypothetical protein